MNWEALEEQPGDEIPGKFSFTDTPNLTKQRPCYISYTNPKTHDLLKEGFDRSPMFNGRIRGLGPRYCPSIEDKIERFSDRDRHQLFLEPEGWDTIEVYVNGFSSSLPEDVQFKALKSVPGMENVRMFRPGYAVEYDFFPPTQLNLTLETQLVENLFFAGQINGTTGYEEAASQGLIAGINAALKLQENDPLILKRDQAYIGVLIDDLVNKGTKEPYRMFTSRAEYRTLLRQDNADLRLTETGYQIGLAKEDRYQRMLEKKKTVEFVQDVITKTSIAPTQVDGYLTSIGSSPLKQKVKTDKVLSRPKVTIGGLVECSQELTSELESIDNEFLEQAEIQIKYAGYIKKERDLAEKMMRLDEIIIPGNFDFENIKALSSEAREKLKKIQPKSLGQASRISGVSPADISILMVYMGR